MMDELPRGWAVASLSSLGDWLGGGTPSKAVREYWENGTVHWVSPKDMKRLLIDSAQDQITIKAVKESATNLVPTNSVLMVTRSGILEHSFPVAINTVPVAINQDLKAFTPHEGLDPTYAAYFLKARAQDILRSCSKDGTTVNSIDSDRLTAYEVAVAPPKEQARIVSKIDELFSRIEEGERALERVQKLVERYRQSVLKAAVTGELTRDWREKNKGKLESGEALLARILKARREAWEKTEADKMKAKGITPANDKWKQKYEEPSPPDTTDLPELPDGWVWASLPMLCQESSTSGISVKGSNTRPGVPALRLDAMKDKGFDYSARRYIPISDEVADKLAIRKGDFFISRANGSIRLVGRGVLAPEPPERIVFPDTMIRYRLVDVPDVRTWLIAIWPSRLLRAQIEERAKTTAGIYKISQQDIGELAIPLPPLNEQEAASSLVDEKIACALHLDSEISQCVRRSWGQRQAVLTSAFAGNLVTQNAADEPASSLLERIGAAHDATPAKPKRGHQNKTEEAA